ncbi:hypothetical protein [Streptomyces sp. NPDC097981]|uniref:hypothetical protein n=1 Tax=Streptomyces sp. NPDC097981 TaxID=3155428 RepID=UPI00332F06A0
MVALLGPVIVGVAVAWLTGVFKEHPRPQKLTEEKYLRPFTDYGHLERPYRVTRRYQKGDCPGPSWISSDPQSIRCGAEDQILDPCWSYGVDTEAVAFCFKSPWDHDVSAITHPSMTNQWPSADKGLPWALEIRDPSHKSTLQCVAGGGTATYVAGMRGNWDCHLPGEDRSAGSALDGITRSQTKPWTVRYASEDSSEVLKADIITVWY